MKHCHCAPGALLLVLGCVPHLDVAPDVQVTRVSAQDCPADFVCARAAGRCIQRTDPCVLRIEGALDGAPDGTPCTLASGQQGICVHAACAASVCGDGFVDTVVRGEVCDDGPDNTDLPVPDPTTACASTARPGRA